MLFLSRTEILMAAKSPLSQHVIPHLASHGFTVSLQIIAQYLKFGSNVGTTRPSYSKLVQDARMDVERGTAYVSNIWFG